MRKTSRIAYAPKSRRKTSSPDRNQSASSNAQGSEEKSERKKPRRRSRIAYHPKSRQKRKSSNAPLLNLDVKQGPQRNKRRANDTATTSLESSRHKHPKRKKGSSSSTDEKSSCCKHSTPELTEVASEVTHKQSTVTKKRVYQRRKQPKQADATPEHIRDLTVTKKTYAKWKLLSSSTKKYAKQVLESTVLSVLNGVGKESKKKGVQVHLKHLSERIIKRLDGIKGPVHKGDYSKMEAESHELQDAVISYNKQIEALEKDLEEQTRLFEKDEQILNNYSNQQQELQLTQLHPLLQTEPVNTLNLPNMSDEASKLSTVCQIPASLQGHAGRLAQSLARISDRAEQVGFTNWLEVLSTRNNAHLNS